MYPNSYSMNLPYRHRVQPPLSSLTYEPLQAGHAVSGAAATADARTPATTLRMHNLEHERSMLLAQTRRANFARAAAEAARAEQVQQASLDYLQFQQQQALRARQMQQAWYQQQQAMLNMSLRAQAAEMATRNALYAGGTHLPYFDMFGMPVVPTTQEAERRRQLYEMDMMAARSRSAIALRSEADRIDAQQRRLVLQRKRVSDQAAAEGRALQSRLANEQAKTEAAAARAAAAAAERAAAEARQAYEAAAIADMRSLQLSAQLSRDRELFGALANRALKGVDVDLYDPLLDDLYVPAKNGDTSSVYTHPWRPSYTSKDVMTWRGRKVRVHHASGRAINETSGPGVTVLDGNSQVGKRMERSPSHRAALVENQELREKIAKVEELSTIAPDMAPLDQKLDIPSRKVPSFSTAILKEPTPPAKTAETATPVLDTDSAAENQQRTKENSKPALEETNEKGKETNVADDQKTEEILSKDSKAPNPTEEKQGTSLTKKEGDPPADEIEEAPADKKEEAPADKKDEAPADKKEEAPADKKEEAPADKKEEAPADKKEEAPADKKGEAPVDKKEEAPADKKEQTSADKKEEAPADKKEEAPADKKEEAPADKKEEAPADKKEEAPADKKEEAPTDKKEDAPADEKVDAPADEKEEAPTDKKEDAPADEKVDAPADEKEKVVAAASRGEDAKEGEVVGSDGTDNVGQETKTAPAETKKAANLSAEEANEAIHNAAASAVGNIISAASPESK